jgi:hypothetical protein
LRAGSAPEAGEREFAGARHASLTDHYNRDLDQRMLEMRAMALAER